MNSLIAAYNSRHGEKCFPSYVFIILQFDEIFYYKDIIMTFLYKKESIFHHGNYYRPLLDNGNMNAQESETWPVQNENTSSQYPVWFSNTEVSVFNLKNTG